MDRFMARRELEDFSNVLGGNTFAMEHFHNCLQTGMMDPHVWTDYENSNDLERRRQQLQRQRPSDLDLYTTVNLEDSSDIEIVQDEQSEGVDEPDYVMGESGCTLTVLDVADTLQTGYACIHGGRARSGAPIFTFPDVSSGQAEVSDESYKNVVTYLASIPATLDSLQDVDLGFAVVVDRRLSKWTAVKTLLLRISGYFPGLVQEVYVLRPSGFFQRTFSDMGFKFVKEEFKFKVLMCSSLDELHQHIDKDQLPKDLGGMLEYNHQEWIQHRAALEKFSSNTSQIGESLRDLCTRLQETEFPNDAQSTEALIRDHEIAQQQLSEELTATIGHGRILLSCFKTVRDEDGHEVELPSSELPANKLAHITAVERLIVQLEETDRNFAEFWQQHAQKLKQCLQFREFEEEFKDLQFTNEKHLGSLREMRDVGDTVHRVDLLNMELHNFEQTSQDDIERAEQLRVSGEQFIAEDHYAVDCIRPKCMELQRICEQYKELLRNRRELLSRSKDLQDRIDRANKWCTRGVDLLAGQQPEHYGTFEGAQTSLAAIETFIDTADDVKLSDPKEFKTMFDNIMTPEMKVTAQQVLHRIDDVRSLCDKRRNSLRKIVERPPRPIQPVYPEPATHLGHSAHEKDHKKRRKASGGRPGHEPRGKVDLVYPGGEGSGDSADRTSPNHHQHNHHHLQQQQQQQPRSGSDSDSLSSPTELIRDMDTLLAKRRKSYTAWHVMKELIETERIYVSELKSILEGYADTMDDPEFQDLLPQELQGKKLQLFGNMRQVYNFHSNVFLKELEACRDTPSLVGRCFVERKEEFQMYSLYCQNKMASDALRRSAGDGNKFFKECQKRLNHRLPLGAYLLKPVQRITKYQLLLKEMLKYTQNDTGTPELEEAFQSMLGVLKYVNDLLHQVAITGYDGKIADAGRLLMQGSFSVWTEHKRIKDLRFKPMLRHLFLFEKLLLFCKKKEDPSNVEKASYMFKNSLQMAKVGLTEELKKGDKKKFEVWLPGRVEVYIIQAPSLEVKNIWITEVKKVLLCQFDQIKENAKKRKDFVGAPTGSISEQLVPLSLSSQSSAFDSLDSSSENNNISKSTISDTESLPYSNNSQQDFTAGLSPVEKIQSPEGVTGVVLGNRRLSSTEEDDEDIGWSSDEFEEGVANDNSHVSSTSASCSELYNTPEFEDLEGLQRYRALADYTAVDSNELTLHEGDLVHVLKDGSEGWSFLRDVSTTAEGWAPASYLECAKRCSTYSTQSTVSSGSSDSEGGGCGRGSDSITSSSAYATASSAGMRTSLSSHGSHGSNGSAKPCVISETLV